MRNDAEYIIKKSIEAVLPDNAVKRALENSELSDNIILVAIGKAAWRMAKSAKDFLGEKISKGIVITKYDHVVEPITGLVCYEAGHPVPDDNSFFATDKAIKLVSNLSENDTVLFLISGGGSALFESPIIDKEELEGITKQLLASGADITEINTIRKRLSNVKGGKFAALCAPAKVHSIILSDIINDPIDMIASGPSSPDSTTSAKATEIIKKYNLSLSSKALAAINMETPKELTNVTNVITGSVSELCKAAGKACEELGYEPEYLTFSETGIARNVGEYLGKLAADYKYTKSAKAYILGGETVVKITGTGKGGRNQELALSAANEISGRDNILIFSLGSDGTDGPTDAAGGIVDGNTKLDLEKIGININRTLDNNDSYTALKKVNGLIITGPTGTNVNDVAVALIRGEK